MTTSYLCVLGILECRSFFTSYARVNKTRYLEKFVKEWSQQVLDKTQAVTFYLHPSFVPGVQTVPPVDRVAVLRLQGWGAFTIGAVADSGRTILEIDLAEVSSAPTKFRER